MGVPTMKRLRSRKKNAEKKTDYNKRRKYNRNNCNYISTAFYRSIF